jgi:molecular chaperone DnaK
MFREVRKQAKVESIDEPAVLQRLRAMAERAKIELSILANTQIRLPNLLERRGKSIDVELILDRETLNGLTGDLVHRTLRVVDLLLERRSIDKQSIDEIVLVGGQTRMPLVIDAIAAHFNKPPRKGVNPDESIALGAALIGDSDTVTLVDTVTGPFDPEILEDVPSDPPNVTTVTPQEPAPGDETPRSGLRDLVRNVFGRR